MTRAQAASVAREARRRKRDDALALRREIETLKAQVSSAGASRFASGINLNLGDISEEYVPELLPLHTRIDVLNRMSNDPLVRAQIRTIMMTLISGVRWKAVGGTPEQRELVEANLLRKGPKRFWCETSWYDRLYEMCSCLIHGFSLFGKTWDVVDGKYIIRRLTWMSPKSVDEDGWDMDERDNLLGVRRTFMDGTGAVQARSYHDIDDLFIVCWDRRGPNWEGNAFIRPLYKPWKIGELAEKIDIIDLQNRGVGIPMAKLSGQGTVKERDALRQILQDMRGGSKERAFIIVDKDSEVKFLTSEGQARSADDLLMRQRANIYSAGGTEFLNAGNTESGSRATGSVMATGFFVNVDGIRILFEDMVNFGCGPLPGLVEDLIDKNYDDAEIEEYPRIEGSRISPTEQLDNIPTVGDLVQKQAITKDVNLENEIRRRLNMPEIEPSEFERLNQKPVANLGGRPDGAERNPEEPDSREDDDSMRFRTALEKKTLDAGRRMTRSAACWPWASLTRG